MYKQEKSLEERTHESALMLSRFPDRVPVIVEKRRPSISTIDKRKYMSPKTLTLGQFTFVIRKRLKLKPSEAIFIFINQKLIHQTQTLGDTYANEKDEDGFIYLIYDFENTFG
tara:strand:+ start:278 stop:616 length:339 start_codon:yes stop_codon:yes gene_type:complete